MKKILLVGEYSSSNLGDNILCRCVEDLVKRRYKDCSIDWLDLTKGDFNIAPRRCFGYLLRILNEFHLYNISKWLNYHQMSQNVSLALNNKSKEKSFDMILFAGGQIFLDYFVYQILKVIQFAEYKKIPVYFNACGGGRLSNASIALLKKVLASKQIRKITLRDSTVLIQRLTPQKVFQLPDAGILCADIFGINKVSDSDIIGLGVICPLVYNANNDEAYSEKFFFVFWKKVIEKITESGKRWQLFVNGSEDDYAFAKRLLNYLPYSEECLLAERPLTAEQLITQISSYKAIISFRLHSYIIAYSLGIPVIGMIWDNKLVEFAQMIHSENNIFQINSFDYDNFLSLFNVSAQPFYDNVVRKQLFHQIEQSFIDIEKDE